MLRVLVVPERSGRNIDPECRHPRSPFMAMDMTVALRRSVGQRVDGFWCTRNVLIARYCRAAAAEAAAVFA
jgi:hypothetical protein